MLEEGYAAVTSRRVATKAALKPALVHYYFETMDDLFLAVYRRRVDQGLDRLERAIAAPQPLWALWEYNRDPRGAGLTMEFVALANHRKAIRAEITASAEQFRERQREAIARLLDDYGVDADEWPAIVLAVAMSSIANFLAIEQATLEMSTGHAETVAAVERLLHSLEGERAC